MLFTESFITDGGKAIFARAAAQEGKIIWTRAATSSLDTDDYTTAEMNALTEATFGTKTSSGFVTNAVVNDPQDTVTVYSEVTNEHYSGEARTFGAWAKIEGDVDDVLVLVARCGNGVTPTTVNPSSSGVVKAFVDFAFEITTEQAQSVEVSEGWYASQAALQTEIAAREALAARVVTTHKKDSTSQGDDQTIRGAKTFTQMISSTAPNAIIGQIKEDSVYNTYFQTTYGGVVYESVPFDEGYANFPLSGFSFYSKDTAHVGTQTEDYHNVQMGVVVESDKYVRNFGLNSGVIVNDTTEKLSEIQTCIVREIKDNQGVLSEVETGRVKIVASEPQDGFSARIDLNAGYDTNGNGYSKAQIEATDIEFNAHDSGSGEYGHIILESIAYLKAQSSYAWFVGHSNDGTVVLSLNETHVTGENEWSLTVTSGGGKTAIIAGSIDDDRDTFTVFPVTTAAGGRHPVTYMNLGTSNIKFSNIYAGTFHGAVDGNVTGNLTGNVTGNVTGNITGNVTGNLIGLIPTVGYEQNPVVGSIFLAHLEASSGTSAKGIGETVTTNDYSIRKAQLSLGSNDEVSASYESGVALLQGEYKLLSAIDALSANETTIALVIRVS